MIVALSTVMFVGGVVAATVELINSQSSPVHSYGAVTRWIVMYPTVLNIYLCLRGPLFTQLGTGLKNYNCLCTDLCQSLSLITETKQN